MRTLISLLFIVLFSSQLVAENINECKTDIYFANGVGAISYDNSHKQGYKQVLLYQIATPNIQNYIGKYDLAFNTGHGTTIDFFEAWLQYIDENIGAKLGWDAFTVAICRATGIGGGAIALSEAVVRKHESHDISRQVKAYEDSIKLGHGVLVLAHSQGNFFTNKAYNSDGGITPWMRDYFKTVGLASPSDVEIPHSSYLTYDNDPISALNGAGEIVRNSMRYYVWLPGPNANVDSASTIPCAPVTIADGAIPTCNEPEWHVEDSSLSDFHAFDYYMQTEATQTDIYKYLTEGIDFHNSIYTASQWELDQELNKGTKKYKITVKHRFDPDIITMQDIEVYPFALSKKLYYVDGNISGYVKASCGGYLVEDTWDGQTCDDVKRLVHTDLTLPHELLRRKCLGGYYLNNCLCELYPIPSAWFSNSGPNSSSKGCWGSAWGMFQLDTENFYSTWEIVSGGPLDIYEGTLDTCNSLGQVNGTWSGWIARLVHYPTVEKYTVLKHTVHTYDDRTTTYTSGSRTGY